MVKAKASQSRRGGGLVGQRGNVLRKGDLAAECGRERGQRRPHAAGVPPGLHEPASARGRWWGKGGATPGGARGKDSVGFESPSHCRIFYQEEEEEEEED